MFLESDSKSGDIEFVERYQNITVQLGLHADAEKVLKDLQDAGLTPKSWIYASFIHQSCVVGDMSQKTFASVCSELLDSDRIVKSILRFYTVT
ncbi:hypothetical protein Smp_171360 [Schistosoma mansoni]|uniref:hypothetical protein n=1 Tax=Schistosoma mansoni TaxID=6183 RepID=UPI0001A61FC9|nr:hypothetical protein Smp_171360 [Schistosoma mansoni]|eukprot:XP_018652546.1 hypothetical protein Smp_171360 [Schistosoma mansoni]